MNNITQDMKYRQSLVLFALKHGVSRTSRRYNKSRSYIYFWLSRYNGAIESLACRSRRPKSHPAQHTEDELGLLRRMRRRNPDLGLCELWCRMRGRGYTRTIVSMYRVLKRLGLQQAPAPKPKYIPKPYEQMLYPGQRVQIDVKYVPSACLVGEIKGKRLYQYTAIDEFTRLRYVDAFEEHSTYSSAVFLEHVVRFFRFPIKCVQTDNGFEFTNRFAATRRDLPTLFEHKAMCLGIRHKLIRPYTPRHNGKVERSHREDQKRFYSKTTFYSFSDFKQQLKAYQYRSNKIPMRPLGWRSPTEYLRHNTVQYV
ncbi:MAG: DDE-type integrase/transposase/recombinase [Christensenellales bacterium]